MRVEINIDFAETGWEEIQIRPGQIVHRPWNVIQHISPRLVQRDRVLLRHAGANF